MAAQNFTTAITVSNSAADAFNAINNVRGWWQGAIEGSTNKLNDEFDYRMKEFHFSKQKAVELVPNKKVVWLVTDSKLSFTKNQSEWTGTKITFDLEETNGKTEIRFTHAGLVPAFECYGNCSNAWGQLVQKSLYSLITTGKGINIF